MSSQNDLELWLKLKEGDRDAFEVIYHLNFKALSYYGLRISKNKNLVQDCIQDVFTNLWTSRSNLSDVTNVRFYLFRSLKNRLLRNREKDIFDINENIDSYLDFLTQCSQEDEIIKSESRTQEIQKLRSAIQHLPQRQQEVIHLRFYADLSLGEIANLMEINKQSVSNILFRSLALLRPILKDLVLILFGYIHINVSFFLILV